MTKIPWFAWSLLPLALIACGGVPTKEPLVELSPLTKRVPFTAEGGVWGKTELWPTGDGGQRKLHPTTEGGLLLEVTREPGSVMGHEIGHEHRFDFRFYFAGGAWNDFVVAGSKKVDGTREFVLERWELEPVQGAYEGISVGNDGPGIGEAAALAWPGGQWVGNKVPSHLREPRAPAKRTRILNGQIPSVDSYFVDGHLRFILIASRQARAIFLVPLQAQAQPEVFLGPDQIPWLANADFVPNIRVQFTKDLVTHYGVYASRVSEDSPSTDGLEAYIADDVDNDGVIDGVWSVARGRKGWAQAFELTDTILPASIHPSRQAQQAK